MNVLLALLVQVNSSEWSDNFEASLTEARKREAVLCVAVVDESEASTGTLQSFEDSSIRLLTTGFVKVKVPPDGKIAKILKARWAPTVFVFQCRKKPLPSAADRACLKTLRERRVSVEFKNIRLSDALHYIGQVGKILIQRTPSILSKRKRFKLKKSQETVGVVIREAARAVEMDYAVIDGIVAVATKDKLFEIQILRELNIARSVQLEGLPELQEEDHRIMKLLKRPIDQPTGERIALSMEANYASSCLQC